MYGDHRKLRSYKERYLFSFDTFLNGFLHELYFLQNYQFNNKFDTLKLNLLVNKENSFFINNVYYKLQRDNIFLKYTKLTYMSTLNLFSNIF